MLREFLSQTNDLSTHCYLTDGGHFDNTGLYSLVERGCRFIVVVDSAADTKPCFADLGNAIRRCRIDFQTEIELDITPFLRESKDERFADTHFQIGTITYSDAHAGMLGWKSKLQPGQKLPAQKLKGVIVLVKPSLLKKADEAVDVRQYGLENSAFPQSN